MNESQGIEETECPSKMASRARRSKILRWLAGKRSRWVAAAVVVVAATGPAVTQYFPDRRIGIGYSTNTN
jgi:uncharacterized membrane protein